MKTADFDFPLPSSAISLRPAEPRDHARLLQVGEKLSNWRVKDLPDLLRPGDLIVGNDTKVIPAQLQGRRGNARIDITLLKALEPTLWQALARPAKKLRLADVVQFGGGFDAVIEEKREAGELYLRFKVSENEFMQMLQASGVLPLPPYIRKARPIDKRDESDYQTIYAREAGAVAAPTAGLHFTEDLFRRLEEKGVRRTFLTLHVGAGTFLPVKTDDPFAHKMHEEIGVIRPEAAQLINQTRKQGGRIIAIGTTVLRLLESAVSFKGEILPFAGGTDIFLFPGHQFKTADLLMTNFHLPKSTLFMLVCAFAGTERMKNAYRYAIEEGYRFYSYGDASLLERA